MNSKVFVKCTILIVGLLASTAFQAFAQGQGGGGRGGMGGMGVLTQEQRTKMRDAIQADMAPLMEKLAAAQKEAVKAALANASEETIKAKLDAVAKAQTEVAVLRLKGVKAIAPTLTAEQKEQLESARDGGYMALFGAMGGGRGGAGGGGNRRNNNQ